LVKVGTTDVPVFTVDNLVFKGTHLFFGPCDAVQITVSGACEDICAAKSVVVDSGNPYAELEASVAPCDCETGYALTIASDWSDTTDCISDSGCCGDDCSGFASWNVKIYDEYPWDDCCAEDPCVEPNAEEDGTACPISITKECIGDVFTPDGWEDFFDQHFWVIATLTDNVGNEIKYYGEVITDPVADTLVSFVELYVDPTSLDCTCYAEDVDAADLVIGDCDGTPATECYAPAEAECPEVTFDPTEPYVGQEVTITIDYTDAVKPVGTVHAYVGPAFKLPDSVLENEVILEEVADDIYEGEVTFSEAGDRILYVVDGCEDCADCMYPITVTAPDICPDVAFLGDPYLVNGVPYYGIEDIDFTVTFAERIEPEMVDVYVGIPGLGPILMPLELPPTVLELLMSTDEEETVYTGTIALSKIEEVLEIAGIVLEHIWPTSCIPMRIYVLAGDPCCVVTCEYPFGIDPVAPCVELIATAGDCDVPCACGFEVLISGTSNACDELMCGDSCTEVTDWTLEVYDTMPFVADVCEDCVISDCIDPIQECSGTGCPVECNVFGCISEEDYLEDYDWEDPFFVVLTVEDAVGNERTTYGVLRVWNPCDADLFCAELDSDVCDCFIMESDCAAMTCAPCEHYCPELSPECDVDPCEPCDPCVPCNNCQQE
jgi:hypothetical protein